MKPNEIGKAYFLSLILVTIAAVIAGVFSSSFQTVTLGTSERILENTIQLDGLLFGFTAVMFTILYARKQTTRKEVRTTVFLITSFLSYIVSLGLSFSYLMQHNTTGYILIPSWLAIIGAVFSSIYMVMVLSESEKKEETA